MRELIGKYCDEYGIPEEDKKVFVDLWEKIDKDVETARKFEAARETLLAADNDSYDLYSPLLREVDSATGAHEYTTDMLIFLTCIDETRKRYEERGIDLSIWRDSMGDVAVKYRECLAVYGIPGIFTKGWHCRFFVPNRFWLGRMQYETWVWDKPYEFHGVKMGDTVIVCHIPSDGKPFDREARMASYKKAYEFYRDLFPDGKMAVCTSSWLLFEDHRKFLKGCPNIVSFLDDFEVIVPNRNYEDGHDLWRIFATPSGNVDLFPTDTALRRSYVEWLRAGNRPGGGFGAFFIDGPGFFVRNS